MGSSFRIPYMYLAHPDARRFAAGKHMQGTGGLVTIDCVCLTPHNLTTFLELACRAKYGTRILGNQAFTTRRSL